EAGHNVTSLIPIMDSAVRDCTEKSHKIYVQPDPELKEFFTQMLRGGVNFFQMNNFNPIGSLKSGPAQAKMFYRTCKKVLEEPGLIERLRAEKYDVYISENFDVCGMGLSHAIQPKAVIGSSATSLFSWQFYEFGVPEATSYRPGCY
ncbi:hypothetical protein PFISCL1PPCAC_7256, partial [Pristionchus fissidentatus]